MISSSKLCSGGRNKHKLLAFRSQGSIGCALRNVACYVIEHILKPFAGAFHGEQDAHNIDLALCGRQQAFP